MPDGATHFLVQIIFNKITGVKRLIPYTLFGTIAPDLFKGLHRLLPPNYSWALYPTHSPIYMLLLFYALALLFHEIERKPLIFGSMIGMLVHLFLDLLQINMGGGYYMPFFPLSFYSFSFNIIKTETSLFFLPITALITLIIIKLKKD
tara:strand:- start:940 stop:1383 length:444 start_codon:yes stop_codon:yes gene_type:complete